eukprot:2107863-Rhodomonas_salina.2
MPMSGIALCHARSSHCASCSQMNSVNVSDKALQVSELCAMGKASSSLVLIGARCATRSKQRYCTRRSRSGRRSRAAPTRAPSRSHAFIHSRHAQ